MEDAHKTRELNDKGLKLLGVGKFEEALRCFDEAIEIGGDMEITLWLNKGRVFKEQGKGDASIECFDRALELERKKKLEYKEETILEPMETNDPVIELCKELETLNEFDSARIEIIEAIGHFKSATSIPYLIKALETDYSVGRDKIAEILTEMEAFEAIPVFSTLLRRDKDSAVRAGCARALGKLGAGDSIEILLDSLKDPSYEVREEALVALEQFEEDKHVADTIKAFKKESTLILQLKDAKDIEKVLYDFDNNELAEKILIEALKDDDREDFNIISALSLLGSAKAVEPLMRIMKDKTMPSDVRASAAIFMGNVEDSRTAEPLLKALKDDDKLVRASAIIALGKLREKRAVEPLIAMLPDGDEATKKHIIDALRLIRPAQILIKSLHDKREAISLAAIEVLSSVKGEDIVKSVKKLVGNEDRFIRNSGLKILFKQEAFQDLIEALGNPKTRQKSLELLSTADPMKVSSLLIKALDHSNEEIRGSAAEILGILKIQEGTNPVINLLSDTSHVVLDRAIEALGRLEAIEQLIEYVEKDVSFSPKALEVLAIYGGEISYEFLIKSLKHNDPAVRVQAVTGLGRIESHRAMNNLVEMLRDKDSKVQCSACWALGKLNSEKVIEPLCKTLKDKDPSVREAVKVALQKLSLEGKLKDKVIDVLQKFCSFSLTALFSKEEQVLQEEGRELLRTIKILDT
ncbi:MAG: HEAT repeat domain-containing protein [Candidatus Eremiobacterota bacterium]